ncbi:mitochondrial transcription rescue factor 1-like [Lethenteron reissneri]|uniref:mitochondrial transcription rescue factor 1-like n=1 Tax=Lethenteron reissneri TaxID=7753 RepID=UPI002AB64FCC|nr:mitochondrial transcription rescue factor 1-like [Lethenteron reissneri]
MLVVPVSRLASALAPRAQAWRSPLRVQPLGAAFIIATTAVVPHAQGQQRRRWWRGGHWGTPAGVVNPARPRDLGPPLRSAWSRGLSTATQGGGGSSYQRGRKGRSKDARPEEDDSNEEQPGEGEEEEEEASFVTQEGVVKDYKDLDKTVASFRFDLVMKAGLDISNKAIEDAFYANRLRLNGQRLIKKSRTVREGDVLDLLLPVPAGAPASASASVPAATTDSGRRGGDAQGEAVARVVVLRASEERSPSQRYGVRLRRWKQLLLPPAPRGTA